MHYVRPSFADDPMHFGRRSLCTSEPAVLEQSNLVADVKLFAATFLAGFLFVSILIG